MLLQDYQKWILDQCYAVCQEIIMMDQIDCHQHNLAGATLQNIYDGIVRHVILQRKMRYAESIDKFIYHSYILGRVFEVNSTPHYHHVPTTDVLHGLGGLICSVGGWDNFIIFSRNTIWFNSSISSSSLRTFLLYIFYLRRFIGSSMKQSQSDRGGGMMGSLLEWDIVFLW